MKTSNFNIECLNCGSNDVVIVDIHKDSDFDEDYKCIKCCSCHAEEEI